MLGILEENIKLKWNVVSNDDKISIRNFLISILLKYINEQVNQMNGSNNHFINKLNNVIVLVIRIYSKYIFIF
jgi:hypothetical protein